MNLNTFVADYIPAHLRRQRDFESGRGWVHLYNQLIRRFEREGLIRSEQVFEIPAFTSDYNTSATTHREHLIKLPPDFAKLIDVFEFNDRDAHYKTVWEDGRLRLVEDYEAMTITYVSGTTPFTVGLSPTTTYALINTSSALATNIYRDYGIFFVSGTAVDQGRIISKSSASGTDHNIYWDKPTSAAPGLNDTCVLLDEFLVLRYLGRYPTLSATADDINVGDGFNTALVHGMCWLASPIQSKERGTYKKEFEEDLEDLGTEVFTPSIEEARPEGAPWPNFNESKADETEYIGE